jgi:hypothetical protein
MQEDLARHGWPKSKISVVWNGVDPDRYSMSRVKKEDVEAIREKYGVPEDWNMLLFVGRLTWVKGVRNLLQAMPTVLREYLLAPFRLRVRVPGRGHVFGVIGLLITLLVLNIKVAESAIMIIALIAIITIEIFFIFTPFWFDAIIRSNTSNHNVVRTTFTRHLPFGIRHFRSRDLLHDEQEVHAVNPEEAHRHIWNDRSDLALETV